MGYSKSSDLCYKRTHLLFDKKNKMDLWTTRILILKPKREPWVRNRRQYLSVDTAVKMYAWYSHHSHRNKRPKVLPVRKNGVNVL
jgi:hypothetical protein